MGLPICLEVIDQTSLTAITGGKWTEPGWMDHGPDPASRVRRQLHPTSSNSVYITASYRSDTATSSPCSPATCHRHCELRLVDMVLASAHT